MHILENVTLTEILSLGLFLISSMKALWDFVYIPKWFEKQSASLSGTRLDETIFAKKRKEDIANKFFSLSVAAVTGVVLLIAFASSDVSES